MAKTTEEKKLVRFIRKRQESLEERRRPFLALWQEIAENIYPLREDMYQNGPGGERKGRRIYDSTPAEALNLFANGLHGYMVSPAIRWFRLVVKKPSDTALNPVARDMDLNSRVDVRRWLDDTEEHLYSVFGESNFYSEIHKHFMDGGAVGTAPLYIQEDVSSGRIIFEEWHPGQVCIAENHWGEVDLMHRKYKVTARNMLKKFGKDALPREIQKAAEDDPFSEYEVIRAIYPREDRNPGRLDARNKPWASVWIYGDHLLMEGGHSQFPGAVWRYQVDGRWEYGFGPGTFALADIMGLHEISKDLLIVAQKEANPPVRAHVDLKGRISIGPNGVNYYENEAQRIEPVFTGSSFSPGLDREEQKRRSIRKHFNTDFFLMLASQEAGRHMTATEVMERQGEKAVVLGAAVSRLNSEVLSRVIKRVIEIEAEAGRLPVPPAVLVDMGAEYDIEYQGPLMQAQRRLFRASGIQRGLEQIIPILEFSPEIRHIINWPETARELLDASGMPARTLNSRDDVKRLMEEEAQAMQAQQAMAAMPTLAKGAKDLAQAASTADQQGDLSEVMQQIMGGGMQ